MILVKTLNHSDVEPLIRAARRLATANEAACKHGYTTGRKKRIQNAIQATLSAAGDVHERLFGDDAPPRRLPPEALDLERLTGAAKRGICAAAMRDATDDHRAVGVYPRLEVALWKAADKQYRARVKNGTAG